MSPHLSVSALQEGVQVGQRRGRLVLEPGEEAPLDRTELHRALRKLLLETRKEMLLFSHGTIAVKKSVKISSTSKRLNFPIRRGGGLLCERCSQCRVISAQGLPITRGRLLSANPIIHLEIWGGVYVRRRKAYANMSPAMQPAVSTTHNSGHLYNHHVRLSAQVLSGDGTPLFASLCGVGTESIQDRRLCKHERDPFTDLRRGI